LEKIPKSVKYLTLTVLIILFVLEFVIFPPLSAQIKHGTFVYQDVFDEYFNQHEENIEILKKENILKSEENKFIGTWGSGGAKFIFKRNGIGTVSGHALVDYYIEIPFTYQLGEQNTIEITGESWNKEGFSTDVYYYEFDNNKLSLIPQDGGKGMYLIKM